MAIVVSVSGEAIIGAQAVLSVANLMAMVAIVIVGTVSVIAGGVALVARAPHRPSTQPQRKIPNSPGANR